eukprot:Nk52_evm14s136 gene=Nk52_evmTU14s136
MEARQQRQQQEPYPSRVHTMTTCSTQEASPQQSWSGDIDMLPLMGEEGGEIETGAGKRSDGHKEEEDQSENEAASLKVKMFIVLVSVFCLTELSVGVFTTSLVLITDSIHMFSDLGSLIVALVALKFAALPATDQYSFGRGRAEFVGAMINSCFLLAVCVFIVLEAADRFLNPSDITSPEYIVYTGCVGFVINIIGVAFFHSHAHHGHGHCHGHGHSHGGGEERKTGPLLNGEDSNNNALHHHHHRRHHHEEGGEGEDDGNGEGELPGERYNANMHAIFLHVLGDLLGSLTVIVSGIVQLCFDNAKFKSVFDSAASCLIACIILVSTIPLIKRCVLIFMQTAPTHSGKSNNNITQMVRSKILQVDNVLRIENLHIWSLTSTHLVCSVCVLITSSGLEKGKKKSLIGNNPLALMDSHQREDENEENDAADTSAAVMNRVNGSIICIQKLLQRHGIRDATVQVRFEE